MLIHVKHVIAKHFVYEIFPFRNKKKRTHPSRVYVSVHIAQVPIPASAVPLRQPK